MDDSSGRRAGDIVTRLIDSLGVTDESGVVPVVAAWREIVGVDLAAHSRIVDLVNGVIFVGVDHPAWLQQLHLGQRRVVATIQKRFPSLHVRRLAFTIVEPDRRGGVGSSAALRGQLAVQPPAQSGDGSAPAVSEPVGTEESVEREPALRRPRAAEDRELQERLTALERAIAEREANGKGESVD